MTDSIKVIIEMHDYLKSKNKKRLQANKNIGSTAKNSKHFSILEVTGFIPKLK